MDLKSLIFHKIVTVQYDPKVSIDAREETIPLPDPKADKLVSEIIKSYREESHLAYAGFSENEWFPTKLLEYENDNIDFYKLSVDGLKKLSGLMRHTPASTGGYLTFAHYKIDGNNFFMIILIKDKEGIGITNNLELEDVHSLDLDKLHFAARINVDRWLATKDDKTIRHISFLKGKGRNDEVVGYFKLFLGIDEEGYIDPARHTNELVNSIKNYCSKFDNEEEAINVRRRAHDYTQSQLEKGKAITLAEISNLLNPEDPNEFIKYIADNEIEIPGEFKPTERNLKKLVKYRIKGENSDYTLSFEQSAIEDHKIWLTEDDCIMISDVPAWVKKEIPRR
ncbi:hypothetical protein FLL45_05205 [Aliikangiella marina]|uniref:Nucleoid-associated protein n=1 Tax=Aliikangiella marina TaxID=1712262 RepID=A0A545TJF4_9GAMM|nr:nucleoid-associated protein [Aliikangiella marina]TQV77343.1 hypothetical protein FLL45_05205 [Aliikangiella marina]